MIDDMIIVDATVHGYNWTPENWAIPEARITSQAGPGFHASVTRDDAYRLTAEEFGRNWQADELEEVLFLESPVDLAVYHGTPIYDFYKDGHSDTTKGYTMRDRSPNRVLVYGGLNPYDGKKALQEMERMVGEHGVNGIKVYAATYSGGKTTEVALDNPQLGYPFIEKALDLGVKVIATHKAIPFGPVHPAPYGMRDLPEVCAMYPEMNFEVVHSGFAFVEETALVIGSLSNVWLNLEVSASFVINSPRRFAEFIGKFLASGAEDRIIFSSGCAFVHPRQTIEAILDFDMPEDLVSGYGYPRLTSEIKRKILGENLLRLHGISGNDLRARIADDEWSRRRATLGEVEPWSHLRARMRAAV
ncbi:MAG TPA: amidohydrolase family protein [Candidatus Dormibacteraeota bacterium]|nr:amidohydrolase family protein [Candidatus Dormibacteraeota bacterium]